MLPPRTHTGTSLNRLSKQIAYQGKSVALVGASLKDGETFSAIELSGAAALKIYEQAETDNPLRKISSFAAGLFTPSPSQPDESPP